MDNKQNIALTEQLVYSATAFGIHIVRQIAAETLSRQPNISLQQFLVILKQYEIQVKKQKETGETVINL
jgi:hypothetical protein